jgi:hypothetical protein
MGAMRGKGTQAGATMTVFAAWIPFPSRRFAAALGRE